MVADEDAVIEGSRAGDGVVVGDHELSVQSRTEQVAHARGHRRRGLADRHDIDEFPGRRRSASAS